jgi:hypothetical protein
VGIELSGTAQLVGIRLHALQGQQCVARRIDSTRCGIDSDAACGEELRTDAVRYRPGPATGAGEVNGMIGRGVIEFIRCRRPCFGQLSVVPATDAGNELAPRDGCCAGLNRLLQFEDAESTLDAAFLEARIDAGPRVMNVCVDQSGNDGAPAKVDLRNAGRHLRTGNRINDTSVSDSEAIADNAAIIDELPVGQKEIGACAGLADQIDGTALSCQPRRQAANSDCGACGQKLTPANRWPALNFQLLFHVGLPRE